MQNLNCGLLRLVIVVLMASGCYSLAEMSRGQVRTVWENEYDGPVSAEDIGFVVITDHDENVLVACWSRGDGTEIDSVLLKYNRTGKLLWRKRYNGAANGNDSLGNIQVDADNNIYLAGTSEGVGTGIDYLTIKYDAAGNLLWDKRFNGTGNSADWVSLFGAMELGDDGACYVTGYSYTAEAHYEFATIKYLPDGTEAWVERYTGPNVDFPNSYGWSIDIGPSGAIYVAGDARNLAGNGDYVLLKYQPDGTLVWDAQFDGLYGLSDSVYDMEIDADENIFLTGISRTAGGFEYCVAKCDSAGNFLWEGRHGGVAGYHYGWILDVDDTGSVYVSGASMTTGGEYDIMTVKWDTNGTKEWTQRYRRIYFAEDWAQDINVGPDGNIYLTGYVSAWFISGLDTVVICYDPAGNELWSEVMDGPGGGDDTGYSMVVNDRSEIILTGTHQGLGTGADVYVRKLSTAAAPELVVTPMPLEENLNGHFGVTGFEPSTQTYLVYSLKGLGGPYVPTLNVVLDLKQPKQLGAVNQSGYGISRNFALVRPGI